MRPGLKTGVENDIFGSEIGAGFRVPGGTLPPRFPKTPTPGANYSQNKLHVFVASLTVPFTHA